MGSNQLAPVQQVVNTIEQFGYHPATVFKFFIIISIIARVTIIHCLSNLEAQEGTRRQRSTSCCKGSLQGPSTGRIHRVCKDNLHHWQPQGCRHRRHHRRRHHRRHHHRRHHRRLLPSTKMLEQWGVFLLIILSINTTVIWCLLSKPIRTSIFQFIMATMVWSANPIQSIIMLHNENMATSYADSRTLTLQPTLPAIAANTYRRPCHLLTMLGLSTGNDLSKPPPDTSICDLSSFERICLRIRAPCCQLGQTQKCHPKPLTPLW